MKIRKNGAWEDYKYRKDGTETDIITSLPAEVIADGNNATVGLAGNMEQSGTPSTTTPIQPQETGERTVNLYDKSAYPALQGYSDNDGMWRENTPSFCSIVMPCEPNTTYVVSKMITNRQRLSTYSSYPQNGDIALQVEKDGDTGSFSDITTHTDAHWLVILLWYDNGDIGWRNRTAEIVDTVQVETGVSKPTAYEPYGYKIPINSRGKNLFDKDASAGSGTVIMPNTVIYTDHKIGSSNGSYVAYLPCEPNTTYRITKTKSARLRCGTTSDVPVKSATLDDYVQAVDGNAATALIRASENAKYICFFYYNSSYDTLSESEIRASIQVEEGSSATPYEPYVQPTLSNIYFGNVQTTRYIKKLIFDGTENWNVNGAGTENEYYSISGTPAVYGNGYSSHYTYRNITLSNTVEGIFVVASGATRVRDKRFSSVSDFKSFLAQQYANGTPVTVWYVLTEPTTGIVNEPIRKIGDYADTVSGITIPTIAGTNIFDVLTTLKPSEVSLAYTGWHPHDSKEYSNNQWVTPT